MKVKSTVHSKRRGLHFGFFEQYWAYNLSEKGSDPLEALRWRGSDPFSERFFDVRRQATIPPTT